jgi:hypothetical protein
MKAQGSGSLSSADLFALALLDGDAAPALPNIG